MRLGFSPVGTGQSVKTYMKMIPATKLFSFLLSSQGWSLSLKNMHTEGLPWWSDGSDAELPMQGAWVQFLVKELDPHAATKSSQAIQPEDPTRGDED